MSLYSVFVTGSVIVEAEDHMSAKNKVVDLFDDTLAYSLGGSTAEDVSNIPAEFIDDIYNTHTNISVNECYNMHKGHPDIPIKHIPDLIKCKRFTREVLTIATTKSEFKPAPHYVYVFKNLDNNRFKIGITSNVNRRYANIKQGTGTNNIEMLYSLKCDGGHKVAKNIESELLKMFSEWVYKGEWVDITENKFLTLFNRYNNLNKLHWEKY